MANKSNSNSNGLGFGTVLFLILLTLKLAKVGDVANWSWWYITAPIWGGVALVIVLIPIIILFSNKK